MRIAALPEHLSNYVSLTAKAMDEALDNLETSSRLKRGAAAMVAMTSLWSAWGGLLLTQVAARSWSRNTATLCL
jgi:uncharacterized protein YbjQ (UPF0145 family)